MTDSNMPALTHRDALIVVDVQNDFLPGGSLGVPEGDQVIPVLNRYMDAFTAHHAMVVFTRDWHPADHCSFEAQGGPWPPHCVQHSEGARFAEALRIPDTLLLVSKAASVERDAYSGFEGTRLTDSLRLAGIERVFIGGLATDYCVLKTVLDALKAGFTVYLLQDAIRAVNVNPEDGSKAIDKMVTEGAQPVSSAEIS